MWEKELINGCLNLAIENALSGNCDALENKDESLKNCFLASLVTGRVEIFTDVFKLK